MQRFVDRAAEVGFAGLITPDVPLEEAQQVADAATAVGLKNIMLIAGSTPLPRCRQIVGLCTGFIYQLATAGITGERDQLADDLADNLQRLRSVTDLPICVGFGISTPDHVRQAGRLADGVIVGSAVVRRITEGLDNDQRHDEIVDSVSAYVADLIAATS